VFWVKNCRFGTTDPKNHAISEMFANSKILQAGHAPGALIAQASDLANVLLACWPILGSVVHSEAFLSTFYNDECSFASNKISIFVSSPQGIVRYQGYFNINYHSKYEEYLFV
jgi:hypothetical protein